MRLLRSDGLVIADRLELARDPAACRRGLLGRISFPSGSALLLPLAPGQRLSTQGMGFALDLLLLDQQGRVISALGYLPPGLLLPPQPAAAAVELPAGTLARLGLGIGDRLGFVA